MKKRCAKKGIEKNNNSTKVLLMIHTFAIFLLSITLCSSSNALVTYYFNGELSDSVGGYSAGTSVTGEFSYDETQSYFNVMSYNGSPLSGRIYYSAFQITVGNETLIGGSPTLASDIRVSEDGNMIIKTAPIFSNETQSANGFYLGFSVRLTDSTAQNINLLQIPNDQLRLSNLTSATFLLSEHTKTNNNGLIMYNETKQVESPLTNLIPEPSALSLLAVGLGGLAMIRRRR